VTILPLWGGLPWGDRMAPVRDAPDCENGEQMDTSARGVALTLEDELAISLKHFGHRLHRWRHTIAFLTLLAVFFGMAIP
jgi:hypothetical protein